MILSALCDGTVVLNVTFTSVGINLKKTGRSKNLLDAVIASLLSVLTNSVDEHPAACVVPLREDGVIRRVEEAEHRRGRQTAADLRTLPPPPLIVQQELHRTQATCREIRKITRVRCAHHHL